MNLLYLHTHDMGRYNQLYGFASRTPAFQSIANDGMLFRNAHCAQPTCSPSRAALLTGRYPHSNGMTGLAHRGSTLDDNTQHLSVFLRDRGYTTALFGIQHEAANPEDLGYSTINIGKSADSRGGRDAIAAEAAVDYINNYQDKAPFFMAVGFHAPHRPFIHDLGDINPNYVQPPSCVPDTSETRLDYAKYLADLEYADACAAKVIRALKANGLYDNTLILLTCDHGIAFPYMKCNLYDTGTGVTLALKIPGYAGGKATDALVSQIDVFPTLCELLDIEKPGWLQGKSLLPILKEEAQQVNDAIFTEITFHASPEAMRAVRTQRYKYIKRYSDFMTPILPNVDNGGTKEFMIAHGFREMVQAREALYDLYLDPTERNNLVSEPECEDLLTAMRRRLTAWMQETDDALLKGDYPPPTGAKHNPLTNYGPNKDEYIQY